MLDRTPKSPPKIAPVPDGVARPLWSVMIPSYNCIKYLTEAIESVLAQAPPEADMQIEVIDDHSTDGDIEALVRPVGKGRVGFYRQSFNVGSLRNFETCINRSKGQLLHILHGDDKVKPGFYNVVASLFNTYPKIGAAFTRCTEIDSDSHDLWDSHPIINAPGIIDGWLDKIAVGQLLQPPSIVVKRSVYEYLGGFFAVHYGEDWEMWARIASKYPVAYTTECVACYRVHKNSITRRSFLSGQNIKDVATVVNIIQRYLPPQKRMRLAKKARRNFAIYFADLTDRFYHDYQNPHAAFLQAKAAFMLSVNRVTTYHLAKITFKLMIRYKLPETTLKH